MMDFYSTSHRDRKFSLVEAVYQGLAPDGGLFMPSMLPHLPHQFLHDLEGRSLQEIAFTVCQTLFSEAISEENMRTIIGRALPFDAPLIRLDEHLYILELFHGPSLSFKDFGARFMAQMMAYLNPEPERMIHVLVATSGDTGSAVGYGFYDLPGFKVWILYPKGRVSSIQEQQLTTIGHNVQALEIEGTFDDCQALVKQAFQDIRLRQRLRLTSANSINIARLIPQIFYYIRAYAQLKGRPQPIFSVPSGNFGNLTAGILAKKMGLPAAKFFAATNVNDAVPRYLATGQFTPLPTRHTLSNAMDVGNPSNFARLRDLFGDNIEAFRKEIAGRGFTDEEMKEAVRELVQKYRYVADPHGAIAYAALRDYVDHMRPGIFLMTAHPAKFHLVIEPIIGEKILIPESLQSVQNRKKEAISLPLSYSAFVDILYQFEQ